MKIKDMTDDELRALITETLSIRDRKDKISRLRDIMYANVLACIAAGLKGKSFAQHWDDVVRSVIRMQSGERAINEIERQSDATPQPAPQPRGLCEVVEVLLKQYEICRKNDSSAGVWTYIDDLRLALAAERKRQELVQEIFSVIRGSNFQWPAMCLREIVLKVRALDAFEEEQQK